MIKIGYFADGKWAHRALDYIIKDSDLKVVFIVGRHNKPDEILKKYADRLGVPFLINENVNSLDFIHVISEISPDINVSMSFDQIFKKDIINIAPLGFINCHAGALPYYRGRNVLNWAIINGEEKFGVTVHYIDEGIDTGDIILQKFQIIEPDDDYGTVLDKAVELCAECLYDALVLIKKGKVKTVPQSSIHPVGFYCGRRLDGDEFIDWNWSSKRIHNFVRAITFPGPCARTYYKNKEIAIIRTSMINNAPNYIGNPGEIVGKNNMGLIVKTGDNMIYVTDMGIVSPEGEIIRSKASDFNIGIRFGFNIYSILKQLELKLGN